jgi:hypothetical protein
MPAEQYEEFVADQIDYQKSLGIIKDLVLD